MLLVAGAFFMENLDATIVTTAAPAMARSLHVGAADVGVAITAYLVTVAAVIPASGWITDRWGARRTFTLAVAVFTVASGLCAICDNLPALIGARVVQAAGGALMVPVGRLTVFQATDRRDLVRVIAWLTWPGLLAPVAAPVIGGALVTYLSWPWIFVVNLPLGAVALVMSLRLVPDTRAADKRPLDVGGLVLSATALALVVYAAQLIATPGSNWVVTTAFGVVGLAAGAWCVRHLLRTAHPLVDLVPLRIQTFRIPHAGGSLFRAAVYAVPFLLALEFQEAFGWTPLRTGIAVMFVFIGNVAIKPTTTPLLRRFGFRTVLLWSVTLCGASMLATGVLDPGSPVALIAVLLIAGGMARSVSFTAYNTIAFADVEPADLTQASTLSSSLQQLAQGMGIALGAVALRAGAVATGLISAGSTILPFRLAFVIIGIICVAATVDTWRLPRTAGAHLAPSTPARP